MVNERVFSIRMIYMIVKLHAKSCIKISREETFRHLLLTAIACVKKIKILFLSFIRKPEETYKKDMIDLILTATFTLHTLGSVMILLSI